MIQKVVATSGYFDPLHVGHLRLFREALKLGDKLVVIVNNDGQAKLKKGKAFMPMEERIEILRALACVDEVIPSIDLDRTVCKTLEMLRPDVFVKGGDSTPENVPEKAACDLMACKIIYQVGGEKIQSSSWLINKKHTSL